LAVYVLDNRKKPLVPCRERQARLLLTRGRAIAHPCHPCAIRDRVRGDVCPVRVKFDPGSETHGNKAKILCLFELAHRRRQMSEAVRPDGINATSCKLLHRADGWRPALPPSAEAGGVKHGRTG
jgi:hypothetical protein